MSIFGNFSKVKPIDSLIGGIIGERGINKSQLEADKAARAQYDTNQLNPRRDMALQMASEGIRDREMREAAVNRIMATDEASMAGMYGGNAAAMIAGASQASDLKSRALAQYEYDLAIQDAQAKLQGEIEYANVTGDMLKMKAALKSTLALNKAAAEAEKSRRKQALIGGLINMAGTAAAAYIGAPVVPKVATQTEGQPIGKYMVEPTETYEIATDYENPLVKKSLEQMNMNGYKMPFNMQSKRYTPEEQGFVAPLAKQETAAQYPAAQKQQVEFTFGPNSRAVPRQSTGFLDWLFPNRQSDNVVIR